MNQQRAVAKSLDRAPTRRRNSRIKARSLSFSIKYNPPGTCELSFGGSMTEPFLSADHFPLDNIFESKLDRAYIDLMGVKYIDDAGIKLLLQIMKKIERKGIKFQLFYASGQVSSKIESSGLNDYFAKPSWFCEERTDFNQ